MLPHEYPNYNSVYWYFAQWRDSGDWQRLHDTVRAQVRQHEGRPKHPTAGCLDSQSVKTTELGGERGYDKGKNVRLLLDSRVADLLRLSNPILVTLFSLKSLFFNGLKKALHFSDNVGA